MADIPRKKWLTVSDVLNDLGIPRRTWQRWRALGKSPECIKLPNGDLRIDPDEYTRWLGTLREGGQAA